MWIDYNSLDVAFSINQCTEIEIELFNIQENNIALSIESIVLLEISPKIQIV
jgi:hypothetical protein